VRLPVAGLRHEARDHTMERHTIVKAVPRELRQWGHMGTKNVKILGDQHSPRAEPAHRGLVCVDASGHRPGSDLTRPVASRT